MKNTMFKRVFAICLVSAVLASTGSAAFSAQADKAENTQSTAAAAAESTATEPFMTDEDIRLQNGIDKENEIIDPEHVVNSVAEYYEYAGIESKNGAAPLPDEVDNSTNENARFLPPIDTQGRIGSCTAWAQTYYQYTYMRNKARNETTTPANTFSPTWTYNLYCCGADKGSNAYNISSFIQTMGAVTIQDVPINRDKTYSSKYLSWYAEKDIWAKATENRISDFTALSSATDGSGPYYPVNKGTPITSAKDSDLDIFKTALNNGEILTYSIDNGYRTKTIKESSENGIDNRFVGEYVMTDCCDYPSGHRMTIVGYNDNIWVDINDNDQVDAGEMGAFKVANSYGTQNGNNGFYWVAYDALNEISAVSGVENDPKRCRIFEYIFSVSVENKDYSSGMLLKCVFNSSCKYEVSVKATAVNKTTNERNTFSFYPTPAFDYYVKENSERDLYFNYAGERGADDGTLYFDLNNVVSNLNPSNINDYTWTFDIKDKLENDSTLIIKECKIVDRNGNTKCDITGNKEFLLNGAVKTISKSNCDSSLIAATAITPAGSLAEKENGHFWTSISGGVKPYTWTKEIIKNGAVIDTLTYTGDSISPGGDMHGVWKGMGDFTFKTTVTDAAGTVYVDTQKYSVKNPVFLDLVPDQQRCHPDETVVFTPKTSCLPTDITSSCFKYTVTKDGVSQQYNADSDNKLNWTPAEIGTYSIKCDIIYNSETIGTKTIEYVVGETLSEVKCNFTTSYDHKDINESGLCEVINENNNFRGAVYPLTVIRELYKDGKIVNEHTYTSNYSNTVHALCEPGEYTFKNTVIDSAGSFAIVTKTINIKNTKITELRPDKKKCYPNEKVKISPITEDISENVSHTGIYKYTITKDGVSTEYTYVPYRNGKILEWTPTEPGEYTIKCDISMEPHYVIYDKYSIATKTLTYTVDEAPAKDVTIYYNGFDHPNIHYRAAGGSWTNVPGVAMEQSHAVSGFPYEYTIDLNGAEYADVCFNDGNNSWDSRNGQNYIFTPGYYTFNNGTITEIEKPGLAAVLELADTDFPAQGVPTHFTASAINGAAPYTYTFKCTHNGSTWNLSEETSSNVCSYTPMEAGVYTISVNVKDAKGKTAQATGTLTAHEPNVTALNTSVEKAYIGQRVDLSMNVNDDFAGTTHLFTVKKNYSINIINAGANTTASWTPSEAGTYTITAGVYYNGNVLSSVSKTFVVEEAPKNEVTIYYNGYSNPNIHYQVGNGSWTNVPGVAMEATDELAGYTHKYTIDLGDADYANVCFNDGHNNWDSRNGANYRFTQGTYKFSNGTITAM